MHVNTQGHRSNERSGPEPLERPRAVDGDTPFPTSGEVFCEIAATISAFLAVALAANLLVMALGG